MSARTGRISELAFEPALTQAHLIRTRQVSPVELVDAYLKRIEAIDEHLGSYITIAADRAIDAARDAERRVVAGDELPLFHGVPVSVKDLIDTAGIRTTHGLTAWADRVPTADAEVVSRLKQAGCIILGKTNTPELGTSIVSETEAFPPGCNPWNTDLTCGGSSGGAAAAVVTGLCALSLGSDGGGSIRIPSAWCGAYGIKPSRGRITDAPAPQHWYAVSGPIARTVADAAAMLDVLSGPAPGDPFPAPVPSRRFADEAGAPQRPLRIAVTTESSIPGGTVAVANRRGAEGAAKLLSDMGHAVEEAAPPWVDLNPALLLSAAMIAAREDLPPVDTWSTANRMVHAIGVNLAATDYVATHNRLQLQFREVGRFFERFDVLLTPSLASPPPRIGAFKDLLIEVGGLDRILSFTPFTALWNQTGQPAVSLPLATDDDGLPVGVQLVGRLFDEATLIRLSAHLELAHPWHERRPPVA